MRCELMRYIKETCVNIYVNDGVEVTKKCVTVMSSYSKRVQQKNDENA